MGNLAHQLHEQLWPLLRGLPQFAYAPGRSCEDALHRVIQHCTTARQLIALHKYPIHNQSQGTTPGEMGGGLILSLDLSKAFDAVDRNQLFQGLERLGVTDDLVNFLKSVYSCTSFSFEHRGCTRTSPPHVASDKDAKLHLDCGQLKRHCCYSPLQNQPARSG